MMQRVYTTIDKSGWGEGPWVGEPDKIIWIDSTGLDCMVRRGPSGAWCGYVGVPPGHSLHGLDYDRIGIAIDVHGGLTYAGACDGDEEAGICHVPRGGRPGDVWWLGFDCGHFMDFHPAMHARLVAACGKFSQPEPEFLPGEGYRDLAYVTAEVVSLASQLAAL